MSRKKVISAPLPLSLPPPLSHSPSLSPSLPPSLSNRAECYLRLNDPQRALHDCNRSLCLDQTMFVKVQWRRSRAYQRMDLDYPAWLDM